MSTDFIPRADSKFNVWQKECYEIVEANADVWKLPAESLSKWKADKMDWDKAYGRASNKETRSRTDVLAKNQNRKSYEKNLRAFFNAHIKYNPLISIDERLQLGLHPRKHSRTPVAVPETAPEGGIDFSTRFQHKIIYQDSLSPHIKAKPEGVTGCQIWMKIGGNTPVDISELSFVKVNTSSPCVIKFDAENLGKQVYYWLRWVNRRGETGPWSPVISAIVAG